MGSGASNTNGIGKTDFMRAKIGFIDFAVLRTLTEFPRLPDKKEVFVDVKNINFMESFVVFVSHRWLRCTPEDKGFFERPHPDTPDHAKFRLLLEGILQLKHDVCPTLQSCFVWIDYSCLDQDKKPASEINQLKKILQLCDCIFTPIVDPIHNWEYQETTQGLFHDYKADGWNKDHNSYLKRGWCRLEMLYAANLPVTFSKQKCASFRGAFRTCLTSDRRPHYLFGTQDYEAKRRPLILGPHKATFVEEYHPLKGIFSVYSDLARVRADMQTFRRKTIASQGYIGDTNYLGQKEGRGKMVYGNGEIYEGEWRANKKEVFGKYTSADGSVYEGEWLNGKKHGMGTFTGWNGDSYEGHFVCGKRCGKGRSTTSNGSVYEGRFSNDKRHGHGIFRLSTGAVYEGEYKNNKQDGYGFMKYCSGDTYEGGYKGGKKNGKGKYKYCIDGRFTDVYEGHYRMGQKHGYGKMTYANGDVYIGNYKSDKASGTGKMVYVCKDVYEGQWLNGKRHGEGVMKYATGDYFKGEYKADQRHGEGMMVYKDGGTYLGRYLDGKREGVGKITYATGDVYDGSWKEGMRDGRGIYKKTTGEVYSGRYLLNKRHGKGKLTYPGGDEYEGEWAEGRRNGEGIYKYADDKTEYHGNWLSGKMHGKGKMVSHSGNVLAEGDWVEGTLQVKEQREIPANKIGEDNPA